MTEATMEAVAVKAEPTAVVMSVQGTLRDLAGKIRYTAAVNVKDISHAESLTQPRPAGNCSNWVVGHLLTIYTKVLPLFG